MISAISFIFSQGWKFFKVEVPGTNFSFGVIAVGCVLIAVGFRFLSIMLGHSIGEASGGVDYASRAASKFHISDERSLDVR